MSRAPATALLALLALAAAGCASSPRPAPAPTRPAPEPPVQPAAEPEEPGAEADADESSGAYGPRTVVIDQPEPEQQETPTLAEAARRAKESRAQEGAPIAVITDETLSDYATGQLSTAAEKPVEEGAEPEASADAEAPEAEERGEAYWRERVRGARLRWRDLLEEAERLEGQVAELRQRFYAEDDGFYRDSQIKPAWDRAIDRLGETRDEARRAQENLATILQEGRLAGALPGWLREGIEYEPAPEEPDDELDIHEATEPPVIDDDGGRSRP